MGLLDDGTPLTVVENTAGYTFIESVAKLSGPNSVIGRSVIIHGDGVNPLARAAQCVIGIVSEAEPEFPLARPAVS